MGFHVRPHFKPADGLSVKYAEDGHLKSIFTLRHGVVDGPCFVFYPNGAIDPKASNSYNDGELDSAVISTDLDSPAACISGALVQVVIPIKKALDIGLSPGEEMLCDRLRLNADIVRASEL